MERITVVDKKVIYLDGGIQEVIDLLCDKKSKGWQTIICEYDHTDELCYMITKRRFENDTEFEKRKKLLDKEDEKNKIFKQKRREKDLRKYLRLKNMFEKEVN